LSEKKGGNMIDTISSREIINCRICNIDKKRDQFVISSTTPVKIHYKDICKQCAGIKGKLVNDLKKANPYPDEDYVCPICQETNQKWYLDHDWKTGEFRAYLCNKCNSGLGLFRDNIDNLNRAISYLSRP